MNDRQTARQSAFKAATRACCGVWQDSRAFGSLTLVAGQKVPEDAATIIEDAVLRRCAHGHYDPLADVVEFHQKRGEEFKTTRVRATERTRS